MQRKLTVSIYTIIRHSSKPKAVKTHPKTKQLIQHLLKKLKKVALGKKLFHYEVRCMNYKTQLSVQGSKAQLRPIRKPRKRNS